MSTNVSPPQRRKFLFTMLGGLGALIGLWLAGSSVNLYSQIGIVMLIGLAAKNGILIVEFANQLRDQGKLRLDDPVSLYLPWFRVPNPFPDAPEITIRQLLTHTSGLGYFSRIEGPLRDAYIELGLVPVRTDGKSLPDTQEFDYAHGLAEFAERLATLPLLAVPGTRWIYSMSPDLLGRVIEVASGRAFDTFLEDRIFSPLGMTSTFFTVPKSEAQRMTSLYSIRDGKADVLVDPGPGSVCLDPPPFLFGGAGLVSSPRDYDRFLLMLAGEGAIGTTRIMSRETARLAMSNLRFLSLILITAGVVLALSVVGLLRIRVDTDFLSYFKEESDVRRAADIIGENLAGVSTFYVVASSDSLDAMREGDVLLVDDICVAGRTLAVLGLAFKPDTGRGHFFCRFAISAFCPESIDCQLGSHFCATILNDPGPALQAGYIQIMIDLDRSFLPDTLIGHRTAERAAGVVDTGYRS